MISAALLSLSLSTGLFVPVADGPPRFDVVNTCRDVGRSSMGVGRTPQACQDDENQARATLEQRWSAYPAQSRNTCVESAQLGGPPSYVQVLTCLEMAPR